MSFEGDSVPQDYVAAANWFRMAADQGHVKAQHNLAVMYDEGQGMPADHAEAAKWYRKAAEQGHAGSQNNLGSLFESGEGVAKDDSEAVAWFRKAAANGDANAVANVGRLEAKLRRDEYNRVVGESVDLISEGHPLIGDCALLPHPRKKLLYALRWLMADYETGQEATTDTILRSKYQSLLPMLGDLFTRLARDWHEIDAEDKEAVSKLDGLDSFPDWALPLKRKYIDDEKASTEACEVAIQVMKDRLDLQSR